MSYLSVLRLPALSGALLTLLIGCSSETPPEQAAEGPMPAALFTTQATAEPMIELLPARLEPFRQAEVRARVAGIVTERVYAEGQNVKKGDVLFRIDPRPLEAAHAAAKARLAQAQAGFDIASDKAKRYEGLQDVRAISERDYEEATADVARTRAELEAARADLLRTGLELAYTRVESPIDGRARRALVTEGALVGQDSTTALTTVEQLDPIYVNFSQPADAVFALQQALRAGSLQTADNALEVELVLPDGSLYEKTGELLFTDLSVNPETNNVAMRALFDNPEHLLLPGAYVQVRLTTAINPQLVRVPREALVRVGNKAFVKAVDANNIVNDQLVRADRMDGGDWLVTEGLQGGERIIVGNAAFYPVGAAVAPIDPTAAGN